MRGWKRFGLVGLTLALCGCTSAGEAPANVPLAATPAAQHKTVARPSIQHVLDVIDENAELVVYLDADAFRQGAAFALLMQALRSRPEGKAFEQTLQDSCDVDPLGAPAAIALSLGMPNGNWDEDSLVVAAQTHVDPKLVLACLRRVAPEISQELVVSGRMLIAGKPEAIRRALLRSKQHTERSAPREYLRASYTGANPFEASELVLSLRRDTAASEARLDAVGRTEEAAALIEQRARQWLADVTTDAKAPTAETPGQTGMANLLEGIDLQRRADRVSARIVSRDTRGELAMFSLLYATSIKEWRSSVREVKAAEARTNVKKLAQALADYANNQKQPRFPRSATRVPEAVPQAAKYQSARAEWEQAGWKELSFGFEQPQFYAYEFATAPNGRQVTVRALGDLDGDGNQSRFELDVTIDHNQVLIGAVREQEPLE